MSCISEHRSLLSSSRHPLCAFCPSFLGVVRCSTGIKEFRAWRDGGELPFLIDNIRDLQRLLDFLEQQPFVDAARIGMAGVSLGGMHTWLCAALDKRVAAAAPMIGVQGFQWAISNHAYHGRVDSLRRAFALIAQECGKVWSAHVGLLS
jgi:dienelactone hydrolase